MRTDVGTDGVGGHFPESLRKQTYVGPSTGVYEGPIRGLRWRVDRQRHVPKTCDRSRKKVFRESSTRLSPDTEYPSGSLQTGKDAVSTPTPSTNLRDRHL